MSRTLCLFVSLSAVLVCSHAVTFGLQLGASDRRVASVGAGAAPRLAAALLERETERVSGPQKGFKPGTKPPNKLPKTASDTGKKSDKPEAKMVPPPDVQKKADGHRSTVAAQSKKLNLNKRGKDIHLVSKEDFKTLTNAMKQKGTNIKNALIKIGGELASKLKSFFSNILSPRFASRSTASKMCQWIVTFDQEKSAKKNPTWSTTVATHTIGDSDKFSTFETGTCQVGSMIERLGWRNCLSGETFKSQSVSGTSSMSANLICTDKNGGTVDPPTGCRTKIQFYGGYKGITGSHSESMLVCPIGSRYIQVSAAQEAQLMVGSTALFSKGIVTSTGNEIEETYSFEFTAGAQGGVDKDGTSKAANVGISFGYTVNEKKDFGEKTNPIAVQGQGAFDTPFNAILQSIAATQVNGAGRVWGEALSVTDAWLLCLVATTTNCGIDNQALAVHSGNEATVAQFNNVCQGLIRTNNVKP